MERAMGFRDFARGLGHVNRVSLPQDMLVGPHPLHHRQQLPVAPEEDVQSRLDRVALIVGPGRYLPPWDRTLLKHEHLVPGISEVGGGGQTGKARAYDYRPHL
jgi:hypothetical protein